MVLGRPYSVTSGLVPRRLSRVSPRIRFIFVPSAYSLFVVVVLLTHRIPNPPPTPPHPQVIGRARAGPCVCVCVRVCVCVGDDEVGAQPTFLVERYPSSDPVCLIATAIAKLRGLGWGKRKIANT